mgnify:CR=1 FL=1
MLQRYLRVSCACLGIVLWLASVAAARPTGQRHQVADPTPYVDILGDIEGTEPAPSKALSDTVWIADWDFDGGGEELFSEGAEGPPPALPMTMGGGSSHASWPPTTA